jgi:Protein of unknown function (DUF2474)
MASSCQSLKLWALRIGWMAVIWMGSVAALAVAASVLRLVMKLCGMKN